MNNKFTEDFFSYYNGIKKKALKEAKEKNIRLKEKVNLGSLELQQVTERIRKAEEEKKSLEYQFETLMVILYKQGLSFNFRCTVEELQEWDNLKLEYKNSTYYIVTKNQSAVYMINKKYSSIINKIIDEYDYSLVVVRREGDLVKVNFRIIGERANK